MLATVGLILIGMASTTWWGPHLAGNSAWALPLDLWGTLAAAQRLLHLDLSGLYTQPTGLVSFPGTALILVPVVALIDAAGISLRWPGVQNTHPAAWLLAGPYEMALSALALFAADAVADRLGVTRPKRAFLAGAEAVAVWSVSVKWGHPEDAVAVGLLLYGIVALADSRPERAAWYMGAAVAVQPLVLLALPVVLVVVPRRLLGFLTRSAAPSALLLGAAASANWTATFHAVTSQPNSPSINHATPWTSLAPRISNDVLAAGPSRALAIVAACACALVVRHGWRGRHGAAWSPDALEEIVWWCGVSLALRSIFEIVMAPYYLWPVLAVALIVGSKSWRRLLVTALAVTAVTFVSQLTWRGSLWSWWTPMVVGTVLILFLARLPLHKGALQPHSRMMDVGTHL